MSHDHYHPSSDRQPRPYTSVPSPEYVPLPDWQLSSRGEWFLQTFGDTSPTGDPQHAVISPNQASSPQSSSLNMALNETLCHPSRGLLPQTRRIPGPPVGHTRILQSCSIHSDEFILFTQKGNHGVTLDAIQTRNRNIDQGDTQIPWSDVSLMHISWEGYPPSRYCLAIKGRLNRFTIQELGKAISDNLTHYMSMHGISLSLDQLSLVAFGRCNCGNDWVAIIDRISQKTSPTMRKM